MKHFDASDALDIISIAAVIFVVVSWLTNAKSRFIWAGFLFLALDYVVVRAFDMYMTLVLFDYLFKILPIALIIVFQDDLKRGFERISTWKVFGDCQPRTTNGVLHAIADVVSHLAEKRIGAIIVMKGQEPLDRHASGGIILEGKVSRPLLWSIFDPNSPGHDGAVIIEGEKVSKFGVHLPLSDNAAYLGLLGTRHSAALGLAERSDAQVIVVSEERGVVSIAEQRTLQQVESAADLVGRLHRFHDRHHLSPQENFWTRFLTEHQLAKACSLAFACLLWFVISDQTETIHRTFAIPVDYRNLPKQLAIDDPHPTEVRVTLAGSERSYALLDPSKLRMRVDLSKIQDGTDEIMLSADSLVLPSNLSVYQILPRMAYINARAVRVSDMPIEVRTQGQLGAGLKIGRIKTEPALVKIEGPFKEDEEANIVTTAPIDLNAISDTMTVKAQIEVKEPFKVVGDTPETIHVTVEVIKDLR